MTFTQSNPRDFSQQSHTAKKVDFKGLGWYCNGLSIWFMFPDTVAINHHLSFCADTILSIYFQVCVEMTHEPPKSWTYWYGYICVCFLKKSPWLMHWCFKFEGKLRPNSSTSSISPKNPVIVQSFQINMCGIIRWSSHRFRLFSNIKQTRFHSEKVINFDCFGHLLEVKKVKNTSLGSREQCFRIAVFTSF